MEKVVRSDREWRDRLSPLAYKVTRRHRTERPFTHEHAIRGGGTFDCVCCGLPLFDAADKFESGTGWPSFTRPIDPSHIGTRSDRKLIFKRTEVHCARCDAHLGHVFGDGPPPTGLRHCINGVALAFDPAGPEAA